MEEKNDCGHITECPYCCQDDIFNTLNKISAMFSITPKKYNAIYLK